MGTLEPPVERAMVVDLGQLVAGALRRKFIVILAIASGLAAGIAWHALAAKRYSSTISFVRNQATEEAPQLGGIASLSMLGMMSQSADPPLLKFIDKYLSTREFVSRLAATSYEGGSLAKAIDPLDTSTSAEAFYGKIVRRVKVIKDGGLISIEVWDRDPKLSLFLTNIIFDRFLADFNEVRRKAIQENLAFANDLTAKSSRDLNLATSALRNFLERNRGLGTPSLEQERNELMLKVRLAEERYLMAEKERGLLEIKNEKKEQSLVVIEKPFLPLNPDYPKRAITLLLPLLAALLLALGLIGFLERRSWITVSRV